MQLISGGDAGDSSADDDDIHDFFCARRREIAVLRGVTRGRKRPKPRALTVKRRNRRRDFTPDPKKARHDSAKIVCEGRQAAWSWAARRVALSAAGQAPVISR
jgi:hypothetical protein